jgi:hypothetical protein
MNSNIIMFLEERASESSDLSDLFEVNSHSSNFRFCH